MSPALQASTAVLVLLSRLSEEPQSPPSQTYPPGPLRPPPPRPDSDLILTRLGPKIRLFGSESDQNQVKIGSEPGLGGGGRRGSGPEG